MNLGADYCTDYNVKASQHTVVVEASTTSSSFRIWPVTVAPTVVLPLLLLVAVVCLLLLMSSWNEPVLSLASGEASLVLQLGTTTREQK